VKLPELFARHFGIHSDHHMGLCDYSKRLVVWRNTADRARHYMPLNEPGGFRKMKKAAIALLLGCICSAPAMFPQGPDGPGGGNNVQRRVAFLTDRLSLTSAQQTQITAILNVADPNASTSRASMKAAHDTLNTAVQANDSATMEQAATTIGNLTAQSTLARAKTDAAIYKVLTPDQRTKYSQIQQDMGRGGPRGRGGRGGDEGGGPGASGDPGPGY
jgi:periplasmic protein CpxP/Spy